VEIRRFRGSVLDAKFARHPELGAHFYEFLCYQEIHFITVIVAETASRKEHHFSE
jgi:hypothetical protein